LPIAKFFAVEKFCTLTGSTHYNGLILCECGFPFAELTNSALNAIVRKLRACRIIQPKIIGQAFSLVSHRLKRRLQTGDTPWQNGGAYFFNFHLLDNLLF
jgi:hypothetical protein